jgi:hypothetical protein
MMVNLLNSLSVFTLSLTVLEDDVCRDGVEGFKTNGE